MKIAILVPVWRIRSWNQLDPGNVFGTLLANTLKERGEEVTLYPIGMGDHPGAQPNCYISSTLHALHMFFAKAEGVDLIHNHLGLFPLLCNPAPMIPVLTTFYAPLAQEEITFTRNSSSLFFYTSACSERVTEVSTFLPAVTPALSPATDDNDSSPGSHLIYAGPIPPDYAVHECIEVALDTQSELFIAGPIEDPVYFSRAVEPLIDGRQIKYSEEFDKDFSFELARAKAFLSGFKKGSSLNPLVLRALTRGVPVITAPSPCLGGFIKNNENGFVVEDRAEAVHAVQQVGSIDRSACRVKSEQHFNLSEMTEQALSLYEKIYTLTRREDHRPWGYYVVLADNPDHKVKRIVVWPEKRLSLQRHRRRSEHWHIIDGKAIVTLNDNTIPLEAGESVDIPKGTAHRIQNPNPNHELVFIEVQRGDYFGEDDIERLEDDFGRV